MRCVLTEAHSADLQISTSEARPGLMLPVDVKGSYELMSEAADVTDELNMDHVTASPSFHNVNFSAPA